MKLSKVCKTHFKSNSGDEHVSKLVLIVIAFIIGLSTFTLCTGVFAKEGQIEKWLSNSASSWFLGVEPDDAPSSSDDDETLDTNGVGGGSIGNPEGGSGDGGGDVVVEELKIIPRSKSTTIIDRDRDVIYGLQEFLTIDALLQNYIDIQGENGRLEVVPVTSGIAGTGTTVTLYDTLGTEDTADDKPVETFGIVVFGDVNGDSFVEALDKTYTDDENLFLTCWSQQYLFNGIEWIANPDYNLYKTIAADLNEDGMIDSTDATNIGDVSIGIATIDQVTGKIIYN